MQKEIRDEIRKVIEEHHKGYLKYLKRLDDQEALSDSSQGTCSVFESDDSTELPKFLKRTVDECRPVPWRKQNRGI